MQQQAGQSNIIIMQPIYCATMRRLAAPIPQTLGETNLGQTAISFCLMPEVLAGPCCVAARSSAMAFRAAAEGTAAAAFPIGR